MSAHALEEESLQPMNPENCTTKSVHSKRDLFSHTQEKTPPTSRAVVRMRISATSTIASLRLMVADISVENERLTTQVDAQRRELLGRISSRKNLERSLEDARSEIVVLRATGERKAAQLRRALSRECAETERLRKQCRATQDDLRAELVETSQAMRRIAERDAEHSRLCAERAAAVAEVARLKLTQQQTDHDIGSLQHVLKQLQQRAGFSGGERRRETVQKL